MHGHHQCAGGLDPLLQTHDLGLHRLGPVSTVRGDAAGKDGVAEMSCRRPTVLGATTFGVAGIANLNAPLDATGAVTTAGLAAGEAAAGAGSDVGLAHLPAVRQAGGGGDAGVGVGSTGGGGERTLWARCSLCKNSSKARKYKIHRCIVL